MSPLASPRRPQREPGRSACGAHTLRTSANAAQAAPGGISVESCQQLAGDARKLCYAVHEASTNRTPRVLREYRNRAEAVVSMCGSISYTQRDICYTNVGHVGRCASISPVQSFVREDQQRPYT
jgi:hypothetical protein